MSDIRLRSPDKAHLARLPHHCQVRFALFCAKQVVHLVLPAHKEIVASTLATVEAYLAGEATQEDCRVVADAAYAAAAAAYAANAAAAAAYAANAAYAAAAYAAYAAAAYAAYAATYAAYAVANLKKDKVIAEQWETYDDLFNIDKSLEKAIGLT